MFEKIDIFGEPLHFHLTNMKSIPTKLGGIFTIATLILMISFLWFVGKDIIFKQRPRSYSEIEVSSRYKNITLTNDMFPISFFVSDVASLDVYEAKYFNLETLYYEYATDSTGNLFLKNFTKLDLKMCKKEDYPMFSEELFVNSYLKKSFCVPSGLDLYGYWSEEALSYLSISFKICNPETNKDCAPEEEIWDNIAKKQINLSFNFLQVQTILNNFTNPMQQYLINPYKFVAKLNKISNYLIQQDSIETDSGWIFEDFSSIPFFTITELQTDFSAYDEGTKQVMRQNFYSSNKSTKYYRSYIKIPDIMALVGGMLKYILVVFQLSNKYFSIINRNLIIINELSKSVKNNLEDSEMKPIKIDKFILQPMVKGENKKVLSSTIQKKEEIKIKKFEYVNKVNKVTNPTLFKKTNDNNSLLKFTSCQYLKVLYRQLLSKTLPSQNESIEKYEQCIDNIEKYFDFMVIMKTLQEVETLKKILEDSKLYDV
jgi:hypothetical protein